jgi:hypothetical protein
MSAAQKAKGPASVGALPDRGSNNPGEEKAVNEQQHSTASKRAPDYLDLEDDLNQTHRFAMILADMIEDALAFRNGEELAGSRRYQFILSRDELENLAFISIHAERSACVAKDHFYEIVEARRSA